MSNNSNSVERQTKISKRNSISDFELSWYVSIGKILKSHEHWWLSHTNKYSFHWKSIIDSDLLIILTQFLLRFICIYIYYLITYVYVSNSKLFIETPYWTLLATSPTQQKGRRNEIAERNSVSAFKLSRHESNGKVAKLHIIPWLMHSNKYVFDKKHSKISQT